MCEWLLKLIEPEVFIQFLIFLGLIWYACETLKLRKASQDQNELKQKPCLLPVGKQRDDDDIKSTLFQARDKSVGIKPEQIEIAYSANGHASLQNVGYGTAFDVEWEIQKREPAKQFKTGRCLFIPKGQRVTTNLVKDEFYTSNQTEDVKLKLSYKSLSGRRYENLMPIRQDNKSETIVVECQFREIPPNTPWRVKICRWICGR